MPVDMGDGIDNSVDEESASGENDPACGERLAAARRTQQITVLEIAKELHLDEPKVRALERNDFDVLGAPVFAKGHMRKYAQLVDVSVDDVMADYYRLTRASGMPPVVLERQKIMQELSPGPWIAAIIVILAAVLAYWFIAMKGGLSFNVGKESTPQDLQLITPAQEGPVVSDEPVLLEAALPDDKSANSEVQASRTAVPIPELSPSAQEAVSNEQLRLALSFSGECWTEIKDSDDRRLFFGMGRSGRNIDLSGRAPISVLLGNVANVSLQVNGNDYSIPTANRRGQTARFNILSP